MQVASLSAWWQSVLPSTAIRGPAGNIASNRRDSRSKNSAVAM
jgi:hypothetical protein